MTYMSLFVEEMFMCVQAEYFFRAEVEGHIEENVSKNKQLFTLPSISSNPP